MRRVAALLVLAAAVAGILLAGLSLLPRFRASGVDRTLSVRAVLGDARDTATVFSPRPTRLLDGTSGRELARAEPWEPWLLRRSGEGLTVRRGSVELAGVRAWLRIETTEGARGEGAGGGPLLVGGKPYRGSLEARVRSDRRGFLLASRVRLEDYLVSVVASEMGDAGLGHPAAARAQAVAARSYTLASRRVGRRDSLGADLLTDVRDQVYGGLLAEREEARGAVRATRDLVLLHGGLPALAHYHGTCGGHTVRPGEVWHEDQPSYLRAVPDSAPGGTDWCAASPDHRWEVRWTEAELREAVAAGRRAGPAASGVGFAHAGAGIGDGASVAAASGAAGGSGVGSFPTGRGTAVAAGPPPRVLEVRVAERTPHGRVAVLTVVTEGAGRTGLADRTGVGPSSASPGARRDTLLFRGEETVHRLPRPDGSPLPSTWFEIVRGPADVSDAARAPADASGGARAPADALDAARAGAGDSAPVHPPASPLPGTALRIRGRGAGHGVGLCQWGAIGRAAAGQDWRTILRAYYPDLEIGAAPDTGWAPEVAPTPGIGAAPDGSR